jgi:hypothetical protein
LTSYREEAARLEAEIAELDAVLAAEILRSGQLVNELKEVEAAVRSDDLVAMWEEIEADFAPIFGERGIYAEIPGRWYPIFRRALERIRRELPEDVYNCIRIQGLKEKHRHLDVNFWVDHKLVDGVSDEQERQADALCDKIFDAADEECRRMEKLLTLMK